MKWRDARSAVVGELPCAQPATERAGYITRSRLPAVVEIAKDLGV